MSKHTPGPWVAEPGGGKGSWVKGSTGEWAALACGDTSESAEANARLIAAAPDMLKALQMEEELNRIGLIRAENDFIEAVNKARRDAIAKAEDRT